VLTNLYAVLEPAIPTRKLETDCQRSLFLFEKIASQETACFSRDAQNNFSRYNCNCYRLC
jgi:hypothetical protein